MLFLPYSCLPFTNLHNFCQQATTCIVSCAVIMKLIISYLLQCQNFNTLKVDTLPEFYSCTSLTVCFYLHFL